MLPTASSIRSDQIEIQIRSKGEGEKGGRGEGGGDQKAPSTHFQLAAKSTPPTPSQTAFPGHLQSGRCLSTASSRTPAAPSRHFVAIRLSGASPFSTHAIVASSASCFALPQKPGVEWTEGPSARDCPAAAMYQGAFCVFGVLAQCLSFFSAKVSKLGSSFFFLIILFPFLFVLLFFLEKGRKKEKRKIWEGEKER